MKGARDRRTVIFPANGRKRICKDYLFREIRAPQRTDLGSPRVLIDHLAETVLLPVGFVDDRGVSA